MTDQSPQNAASDTVTPQVDDATAQAALAAMGKDTAVKALAEGETSLLGEVRNLAFLLFIVLCIHSFIGKPFYIPSGSMMPALLQGDRLIVSKYPYGWSFSSVSFHLAPPFSGKLFGRYPERGDIVTVEPNGVRVDYIKRVIGLPGDVIAVRNGRLIINGTPVKSEVMPARDLPYDANQGCEGFINGVRRLPDGRKVCQVPIVRETLPNGATYDTIDETYNPYADEFPPTLVPAGHVFLMGDNRDHSADGRFPVSQLGLGGPVPVENISGRAEFITFSLDGSSQWYNPISWFTAMRSGRAGTSLRPDRVKPPAPPAPQTAPKG